MRGLPSMLEPFTTPYHSLQLAEDEFVNKPFLSGFVQSHAMPGTIHQIGYSCAHRRGEVWNAAQMEKSRL